ncbi:MAG: hypothetical protein P1V97_15700 [Planctomycetota bacterium]|nr:hypothetical protein [Planctomycetota bacterium]
MNSYMKPGQYSPKYFVLFVCLVLFAFSYHLYEQRKENPEHWIKLDRMLFRVESFDSKIGKGEKPLDPHYLPKIVMGITGVLFVCSIFLKGYHKAQTIQFDGQTLVIDEGDRIRPFPHSQTTIRRTPLRGDQSPQNKATQFATGTPPGKAFFMVTLKNRESGDYLKLHTHEFSDSQELSQDLQKFAKLCESPSQSS